MLPGKGKILVTLFLTGKSVVVCISVVFVKGIVKGEGAEVATLFISDRSGTLQVYLIILSL